MNRKGERKKKSNLKFKSAEQLYSFDLYLQEKVKKCLFDLRWNSDSTKRVSLLQPCSSIRRANGDMMVAASLCSHDSPIEVVDRNY